MTDYELGNATSEVKNALGQIISEAEEFANVNILNNGLLSFGEGWNDACGKKISQTLIATVKDAVDKNLKIYDCEAKLDKIADDISPLISIIESAKKELQ